MNMQDDLLPGFRFYPTEEELVSFYLHNKLNCSRTADIDRVIPVVDIYDYNPWDLPQVAEDLGIGPAADGGEQWFFFIPRQERESRGGRPNRLTTEGFWKATGSPCDVYSSNNCVNVIGRKRTMVFYAGRAPNGTKTLWKMNEYKAIDHHQASASSSSSSSTAANPQLRDEVSLCRIYKKSRSSLWAFDRRPPVRGDQLAAAVTPNDASTLMTYEYDQHMINTPAEQTNIPDNSISHIDDIPSSQLMQMQLPLENDNINNAFDEPLWDSQEFNIRFDM